MTDEEFARWAEAVRAARAESQAAEVLYREMLLAFRGHAGSREDVDAAWELLQAATTKELAVSDTTYWREE